jgi:hypothetical protein
VKAQHREAFARQLELDDGHPEAGMTLEDA